MSDEDGTNELAQPPSEQAQSTEPDPSEEPDEEGQPDIGADEQATIPDDIEVTGEDIEAEAAESEGTEAGSSVEEGPVPGEGTDGMAPSESKSPVKAGEIYVTLVHQATNAAIRARGDAETGGVERDHFAEYDLAHYFDLTMEDMGVGSDLDPHEALLLSTALAMGEPILTETDVLDQQIGRLMDTAAEAGGGAA